MTDHQPHTDPEHDPGPLSTLRMLWDKSWTYLAIGLVVSLLLHAASLLTVFLAPEPVPDLEAEWLGRFGSLSGIGHGVEDFDPHQDVDWDDMAEFTPDDEGDRGDDEAVEEEPADIDEPEDVDKPEESEESEEPEEPAEPDEQINENTAEEIDEGPGPGPTEVAEDDNTDDTEIAEESDDPEETDEHNEIEAEIAEPTPAQFDRLPGVDRSSPSNLPDLRNYGPGNARMTALIRLDRLRGTPLQEHVNNLLTYVPDYRILLEGTGLQAVDELDAIFMASADPTHLHQTFLAVRHDYEQDELRQILDNRFADPLQWETEGNYPVRPLIPSTGRYRDPRRLLLTPSGLAIVGRPEWFPELIGPVDPQSPLGQELAQADAGASAFQLLDGLARIEEVADQEDTLVLVSAYGLIFYAPGVGRFPRFEAVRLSITNPAAPALTIDLRFATTALARDFARACPTMKRQIIGAIPFARTLGVASLVERLECTLDDDYVTVTGTYTTRELTSAIQLATPFMPRPPSLTGLPPGPAPPTPADPTTPSDGESAPDPALPDSADSTDTTNPNSDTATDTTDAPPRTRQLDKSPRRRP